MEPVTSPIMDSFPNVSETMPAASPVNTVPLNSEHDQTKAMLAEARATRDMLVGFRAAVESGNYHGSKMLDLAKGLAFMEAILKQNNAHISNLQEKLSK
jgi:hypothetical protein